MKNPLNNIRRRCRRTALWRRLRPAWLEFRRAAFPRGRRVLLNGAHRMQLDWGCYLTHPSRPSYEPEMLRVFARSVKPGATVIDVGANQGLFSLVAARRVGSSGCIYAVEANAAAMELLRRNVKLCKLDSIVTPVHCLVGSQCGELRPFHAPEHAAGWASAVEAVAGTRTILMPTTTIDEICGSQKLAPAAIKIDVEGMELEVLRGARGVLETHRPLLFVALHDLDESEIESLRDLLSVNAYSAYLPNGEKAGGLGRGEYVFCPRGKIR